MFVELPLSLPGLLNTFLMNLFDTLLTFKACFLRAELVVIKFLIMYHFFWLFTCKNFFMLLCKTLFTTYLGFFPSVTHDVFVNFIFIGIGLSTINTHTAGWLFEFGYLSMLCKNSMCFAMATFEVSMS